MSSSKQSKHNTYPLQDHTAIVTGSDSGISQETARILAQLGCHVVICYHSDEKSTKVTAKLVEAAGHQGTAGVGTPVMETDFNEWENVIRTNLHGPSMCAKLAG
ncbi:unnamed protein product [Rotaria sp. Silwood1]|nr:unnamed protein product [Rotaria sp. Silwood1]CAF5050614.1 unnamed protein product [Rotaria sp. Silwood1]CAF5098007.1 unnamed protein product [Rotaria sp. Silwood1]